MPCSQQPQLKPYGQPGPRRGAAVVQGRDKELRSAVQVTHDGVMMSLHTSAPPLPAPTCTYLHLPAFAPPSACTCLHLHLPASAPPLPRLCPASACTYLHLPAPTCLCPASACTYLHLPAPTCHLCGSGGGGLHHSQSASACYCLTGRTQATPQLLEAAPPLRPSAPACPSPTKQNKWI